MVKPTTAEVRAEAVRIHRCPDDSNGPCWGPTQRDYEQAEANLGTRPSGSSHAGGGDS